MRQFERQAVSEEQIGHLALPTRPTKKTDSRAGDFTGDSVEVDAVRPNTLRAIAHAAVEQHIDSHDLEITRIHERSERALRARAATSIAGGHQDDERTSR
jgi:hypothetical protein